MHILFAAALLCLCVTTLQKNALQNGADVTLAMPSAAVEQLFGEGSEMLGTALGTRKCVEDCRARRHDKTRRLGWAAALRDTAPSTIDRTRTRTPKSIVGARVEPCRCLVPLGAT